MGLRLTLVVSALLLPMAPRAADAQIKLDHQELSRSRREAAEARAFWRPRVVVSNGSLFDALGEFGRRANDNRLLRSRGVIRPLSFHYKNFSYDRNFFHVYKGFRLRSFMDGKLDLGLYKHRVQQGMMFGPAGAYLPNAWNRLELILRWNLNEQ